MLAMEEVLCELSDHEKRNEQGLPPGFRFHPTDEELITFYLASKVFNGCFTTVKFAEVDLNRCEPWELPGIYSSAQTLTRRDVHVQFHQPYYDAEKVITVDTIFKSVQRQIKRVLVIRYVCMLYILPAGFGLIFRLIREN